MKIVPRNDKILVKRLDPPKQSKGGILIPDNAQKDQPKAGLAKVIAVGPGGWNEDHTVRVAHGVNVGDTVLFGKYTGWDTTVDGEEYVVLREDDVLAIVET